MSKRDFTPKEQGRIQTSKGPSVIMTANGTEESNNICL